MRLEDVIPKEAPAGWKMVSNEPTAFSLRDASFIKLDAPRLFVSVSAGWKLDFLRDKRLDHDVHVSISQRRTWGSLPSRATDVHVECVFTAFGWNKLEKVREASGPTVRHFHLNLPREATR